MKTLILKKSTSGQFIYSITDGSRTIVPDQYGTYDRESTIVQARGRFSFDTVEPETLSPMESAQAQAVQTVESARETLAQSDRGNNMIESLAVFSRAFHRLDSGNMEAVREIMAVILTGDYSGTLAGLLAGYK